MADRFYAYENWVAHGHTARLHRGSCSFCTDGVGKTGQKAPRNGKWLGPFATVRQAEDAATKVGAEVSRCRFCAP